MPRSAGHLAGVESARKAIRFCAQHSVNVLTLFAFSSENWQRPSDEVQHIFSLLFRTLGREIKQLHANNVQFRVIGDRNRLSDSLNARIDSAEKLTQENTGLKLVIALNYGGRWDITQACRRIVEAVEKKELSADQIDERLFQSYLALPDLPEPDLFIRTSGEQRISNFFLWQLSYSEFYFPSCHWPDFDETAFQAALDFFATRQRRYGLTGEQLGKHDA